MERKPSREADIARKHPHERLTTLVALVVACVTGTLLFGWCVPARSWQAVLCGALMLVAVTYLTYVDTRHHPPVEDFDDPDLP